MASELDIFDDELLTVLAFYHDLGVLVYFGGDNVTLRNTVILKPAWLVDMFRRVIAAKDNDVSCIVCFVAINRWMTISNKT